VALARRVAIWASALAVALTGAGIATAAPSPVGEADFCTGPAGQPVPFSPEWQLREAENVACQSQGSLDHDTNPAYYAALAQATAQWQQDPGRGRLPNADPFRHPKLFWAGSRGRYQHSWITTSNGARLSTEIFAPKTGTGPFPVVVFEHGGSAAKEMWWFLPEALAEAGYVAVIFDALGGTGGSQAAPSGAKAPAEPDYLYSARAALDHTLATPARRTAKGEFNPMWRLIDRGRVAVAGQSLGAISMNYLGQTDPRVDTIVSYDSCERFQSATGVAAPGDPTFAVTGCRPDPYPLKPADLRKPMLHIGADGALGGTHVRPAPMDPSYKNLYYDALTARGIEAMQVNLRASNHNDSATATGPPFHTRYGEMVHLYYTMAWLDYSLKGAGSDSAARGTRLTACRRLTARSFDGFVDRHSMGAGRFDAARAAAAGNVLAGNVSPTIGGRLVKDRLSFHFASAYRLQGGRTQTSDMVDSTPGCSTG
jgi:dienelactone hydrolase